MGCAEAVQANLHHLAELIGGALLHKSDDDRSSPFSGHTYPSATVTGMPRAVKRFITAARI